MLSQIHCTPLKATTCYLAAVGVRRLSQRNFIMQTAWWRIIRAVCIECLYWISWLFVSTGLPRWRREESISWVPLLFVYSYPLSLRLSSVSSVYETTIATPAWRRPSSSADLRLPRKLVRPLNIIRGLIYKLCHRFMFGWWESMNGRRLVGHRNDTEGE